MPKIKDKQEIIEENATVAKIKKIKIPEPYAAPDEEVYKTAYCAKCRGVTKVKKGSGMVITMLVNEKRKLRLAGQCGVKGCGTSVSKFLANPTSWNQ